ncbi:ATP-binding protein [uncultured Nocardioides sp.]|uniref:sensor histidine kinase n=1 Tax=uncultured Nocardioides sp. TaxID=198441 RepID=UPI002602CFBC|nr:ATP-binding protein [uncultured Nocardioides sp.]
MTRALSPARAVAFAAAYVVLTLVGRATAIEGQVVSLVWPGSGVAFLWLLAESPRHVLRVLAPLLVLHFGVVVATGVSPLLGLFGAVSVTLQTAVAGLLLRRWCPTMLGAGGTQSIRSPRNLAATAGAAAVGCALGAVVGTLGLWLDGATVEALTPVAWFARHVVGVLTVGAVGHLAWEWHTQPIPARTHGGSRTELVLLWVLSVASTALLFVQPYPVVFLVIGFAVWSAARFRTFPAALHCLVLGGIALVLSLTGHGPFASIEDPVAEVLVSQLFMVAVLLTGLAVGALGDRVDELYAAATAARADAAEKAELLGEMTESMDEGLVVLDPDGRVERSNGASRRLAHRVSTATTDADALSELVGLLSDPAPSRTGAVRAELGVGDVVIALPSGEEVVLAVSRATLSRSSGSPGVLLVMREVTEHRSGLRPLAGFASTAAHDLRGPLSAIRSWLSLAVDDLEPGSEAAEPLRRAERASEQMGELIGDLLEHALAESGEIAAREVSITGSGGVLDQVSGLLGPEDVLEADPDLPSVRADPVAVRQLFGNLIGNAVKYARPGEPATITVRARRQGSRVVVEVEDHGVGVDDSERALIFQRFHRSGAVRAHFRGTGMGLSICQTIVQRHGGTIECLATPPGSGTVFRFDLPAAEPGREVSTGLSRGTIPP